MSEHFLMSFLCTSNNLNKNHASICYFMSALKMKQRYGIPPGKLVVFFFQPKSMNISLKRMSQ